MKLIEMLSTKGKLALLNQIVLGTTSEGDKVTLVDRVVYIADMLCTSYCDNVSYQDCIAEATETVLQETL